MKENKKAQLSGIGGRVLVVIFGVILLISVGIPIVDSVISQTQIIPDPANASLNITVRVFTGTTATIMGFIPLFLALAGLALAAALVAA